MAKTSKKKKRHTLATSAQIQFADNVFWDKNDPDSCPVVATTIPHNFVVKPNQPKARWDLQYTAVKNVTFNPALVDLRFKDINPTTNKVRGSAANPFILADIKDASAGRYVYHVLYDGNEAQDPELDISN